MKRQQQSKFGITVSWLLAAATTTGTLHAGVIATNGDVPAGMNNTAGTESDPSVYVFDNYTRDFGTTSIGVGTASGANWVRLEIRNGAQVSTAGTGNRIGSDSGAHTNQFNSVLVTGSGSSLTLANTRIGGMSPNNSLIVQDGALMTFTGETNNGFNETPVATNNTVVVDNATLHINDNILFRIGYATEHNYNSLVVRNGGQVTTATGRIGVRFGKYNDFRVEGHGSRIDIGRGDGSALRLGESATHALYNTLTLVDGGLCRLTHSSGTIGGLTNEGNGVRFAAGFLAVAGNRQALVPVTSAWLWSGSEWEAAPIDWVGTFYTDDAAGEAAAFAATGYSGLAGFTVFTGGEPINPPPPLATLMIIK